MAGPAPLAVCSSECGEAVVNAAIMRYPFVLSRSSLEECPAAGVPPIRCGSCISFFFFIYLCQFTKKNFTHENVSYVEESHRFRQGGWGRDPV